MTAPRETGAAAEMLYREALYLDERRWDDWLALYHEEAEFWVPAWKDDDAATNDPENEVSLIYISSRAQLAERVSRVRSGRSPASTPLPRTAHAVSNILARPGDADGTLVVNSIATTHNFDLKRREQHVFFSRCEHHLERAGDDWRIRRKKVLLLNDYIPMVIDFYSI